MSDKGTLGRGGDEWLRAALSAVRRTSPDRDGSRGVGDPGSCPDAELLAAYVENALDPGEREGLEQHAATCDRCLETLAVLAASFGDAADRSVEAATSHWWRRWSTWLVPATAAATALGLYLAVQPPGAPRVDEAREPVGDTQVARAPEPAAPPASPEASVLERKREVQPSPAALPARPTSPAKLKDDAVANHSAAPPAVTVERGEPVEALAAAKPPEERQAAPAQSDEARMARRESVSPPGPSLRSAEVAPRASPTGARQVTAQPSVGSEAGQAGRFDARGATVEARSPRGLVVWRFGPGPSVAASRDGGATWQPQVSLPSKQAALAREMTGPSRHVLAASAPEDAVCWAVGTAGFVSMTTDGVTWVARPFLEVVDLVSVSAHDAQKAVVVTRDGRSFETRDGGLTWQHP